MTQAERFDELGEMIQDAMRLWIETTIEQGLPIPEPRPLEVYSGRFVTRIPKSLHRELAEAAERDNVSLNAFVNVALAKAVKAPPNHDTKLVNEALSINDDKENLPHPQWPKLSHPARRAMMAAGLKDEARIVDEQLFADWINAGLAQIDAANNSAYYKEAEQYLDQVRRALELCAGVSPLMGAFSTTTMMFAQQLRITNDLRGGVIQQALSQSRLHSELQHTFRSISDSLTSQETTDLSYRSYQALDSPFIQVSGR
jgi:predicted HicB family RNase H-like nuclease